MDLATSAAQLRERLTATKRQLAAINFEWYPYDTLSSVDRIVRLLGNRHQQILDCARNEGVLDLGCQDGELSFLFESLGCPVTALDNPLSNHNGLRGVRALIDARQSSVALHERDFDSQFVLPGARYGLAIFLGVLYHLKNPYYVMETLARHARYCMLSTRIARRLPDGKPMPNGMPVAYLLDAYELNDDDSNFWILSDPALRRLLKRTGWNVLEYFSIGDTQNSDPVTLQHDERAFCLLQSYYALAHLKLLDGWYEPEDTGWRWTKQNFSLVLPADLKRAGESIDIRMFLPDAVFSSVGPVTLRTKIDGREMKPVLLDKPGAHRARFPLDRKPIDTTVEFSLDKALSAEAGDGRELGVIIASVDVR